VLIGVAGLATAGSLHPVFGVTDHELLGFDLNTAHNVLHLVAGAAGLWAMRSLRTARGFGHVIYFFFGVQLLIGLVGEHLPALNFLGVDGLDNLMHAVLALVGLAIAWGPEHLTGLRPPSR